MMKRLNYQLLMLGSTMALACAGAPSQAYGQWTVEDPFNLAYNIKHYTEVVQQVSMQVQQLKAQLVAMQRLAEYPGRTLQPSVQSLTTLMGQPGSLSYAAPNVMSTFQRYFNPNTVVSNWVSTQAATTQATLGVTQQAMASTAAQQSTLAPGAEVLARMQQINTGLVGPEQALELQNTALIYIAQELMLLRQQLMTQINLQATYNAQNLAQRAQADTSARAFIDANTTPYVPTPTFSLYINP